MAYERKDNDGVLFNNTHKEKETHPDFKGNATINGVEYWVSGWEKKSLNGNRFISLSFQKKEAEGAPSASKPEKLSRPAPRPAHTEDLPDDDLPF